MMNKIKRTMFFETDDPKELDEHYQDRLTGLHANSYGMNDYDYENIRASISNDYFYDIQVLKYRQKHRDKWQKYQDKLNPPKDTLEEDTPTQQPEPQPQPVTCTAVEIINRDLLTSPTEADPSMAVAEEE